MDRDERHDYYLEAISMDLSRIAAALEVLAGAKPLKPILPDLTPEEEEKLKQGLPITRIEYV